MDQELSPIEQFTEMIGGATIPQEEMVGSVIIRTSNGRDFAVAVEEPTSIGDLFASNNLTTSQNMDLFVDGAQVDWDHRVSPGTTVTAVGTVKGGR